MWRRKQADDQAAKEEPRPLKEAIREARIESAERAAVVVDLRDAELARLERLNEALDPVFADIAPEIDLFERGISHGETPRLWIDAVAHVVMGRDKRLYRFLLDGRFGRKVLAESFEVEEIVAAVTRYVARRLVERERALSDDTLWLSPQAERAAERLRRRRRWQQGKAFLLGLLLGVAALLAAAWFLGAPD